MKPEIVIIELYDAGLKMTTKIYVEKLGENLFRTTENELFIEELTLGTEFETIINEEGKHEVIRITQASKYVTTQFILPTQFSAFRLRAIGDVIVKNGGHWQTDMGGIATINLLPDSAFTINNVFTFLGIQSGETDDNNESF